MSLERKLVGAEELVWLIGHVGPGVRIPVRIYSADAEPKRIANGTTNWSDDRAGCPVVAFNDVRSGEEWLIPLGGQTIYKSPPRISSSMEVNHTGMYFGETTIHQQPIDISAQSFQFEVIEGRKK